ncbi:MAG: MotA/TolQ/ExbB proton channel family protein [Dechloromonas sp.]|nr:MotA/TolQ/ExbB proton channel family protein [Dechloromonas sp.]
MNLNLPIDTLMYGIAQLFLLPVLLAIALLFLYAFFALGAFAWQALQRKSGIASAFELRSLRQARPRLSLAEIEAEAMNRLEFIRIATRVTPMLGLVATMIPMGPALRALGDGQLADVANSLTVAFSSVILALLAAAITYAIAHVRRRWYADELLQLEIAEGKQA